MLAESHIHAVLSLCMLHVCFDISCSSTLKERRRNCALTPLATSQQHNQDPVSPARLRRLRLLLDANLDRDSSEEELERISRGENRKWMSSLPQCHGDHHSSASSDEEVRDLCCCRSPPAPPRPLVESSACFAATPSPVLFSSSPPHSLKPPPMRFQLQVVKPVARPIILTHFDQTAPYRRYRHSYGGEPGRPSLDLEKMQQVSRICLFAFFPTVCTGFRETGVFENNQIYYLLNQECYK